MKKLQLRYLAIPVLAVGALALVVVNRPTPAPVQAQPGAALPVINVDAEPTGNLSLAPAGFGVTPNTGSDDALTFLQIQGQDFASGTRVSLASGETKRPLNDVSVSNPNRVLAVVPDGFAPGTYDLVLTSPTGQETRLPAAFVVTSPAPLPQLTQPAEARATGPTDLTIDGFNFRTGARVDLVQGDRTTPLAVVNRVSSTRLEAVVPAGLAPGAYDVVVANPTQAKPGSLSQGLTIVP